MKFLSADSVACRNPSSVCGTRARAVWSRARACGDLGPDAEEDPRHVDRGQVLLGAPLADQADVADARVLQLPDRGHLEAGRVAIRAQTPLGPAERLPAASRPVVVVGLRTNRLGRNGRFFSCFSRWLAAASSSRCEAISGRLLIAIGTSSPRSGRPESA